MKFLIILLSILWIAFAVQAQCPLPSNCNPGSSQVANTSLGLGIYRVQLANIDTTTNGAIDGYKDYSCQQWAVLVQNTSYTLRVQTGTQTAENVVAWLDYNNDGNFTASEQVMYSPNAFAHMATFTIPATATLGQSLRLRIAADNANSPIPTACSTPQYSQTEDYQVRIAAGNPAPIAHFTSPDSITCTGVVAFRDDSRNAPANWRWSFGDGSTSTQQHPTHTYTAAGTYSVKLRVCNAGGCDSLTRTSYVLVRNDGPRPASCQPATVSYCCQYGLTRVHLAGLDHSSLDGQAGYEDFSCAYRATLTVDRPYSLQLTTGGTNPHDVRVFLDLNDDGVFTSPGELLYYGYGVRNPTVSLNIASTLATVYNKALRLRLVADYGNSPATSPCGPVQWGQAEDYSVVLVPNMSKPTAAFTLNYTQRCGPTKVAFVNATVGGATSYQWDFGDGTTSTQATPPTHTYSVAGVYPTKLVAQNAFGSDSVTHRIAATTSCLSYCALSGSGGTADKPAYVTRLQLADLDNTDYRGLGIGYWDYTAKTATVQAGQTYPLRTESLPWSFAGAGPWLALDIWIDFNQDGQFSAAERIVSHSPYQYVYVTACSPAGLGGSVEDYSVLVLPPATAPVTGFFADQPATCTGLVQFRDTSALAPTRWQWTFGDGDTSSLQHPTHQYATPGTYSVSLQAGNTYGTQTLTRSNYVTVSALLTGPRPAACLPSPLTGLATAQSGIDTLKIGAAFIYHQPPGTPAYRDETCTIGALALTPGATYAVRFRPYYFNTHVAIWLDANDNGVFEAPGELIATQATLTVPATTLPGRQLRLRVVAWGYDYLNPAPLPPGPCQRTDLVDHVRDFTVVVGGPLATTIKNSTHPEWQMYPNPATSQVTIRGNFFTPAMVELWNTVGRCCYRASVSPNAAGALLLDVSALPHGLYFVRVNENSKGAKLLIE
jgi:PKD repeat protein